MTSTICTIFSNFIDGLISAIAFQELIACHFIGKRLQFLASKLSEIQNSTKSDGSISTWTESYEPYEYEPEFDHPSLTRNQIIAFNVASSL